MYVINFLIFINGEKEENSTLKHFVSNNYKEWNQYTMSNKAGKQRLHKKIKQNQTHNTKTKVKIQHKNNHNKKKKKTKTSVICKPLISKDKQIILIKNNKIILSNA